MVGVEGVAEKQLTREHSVRPLDHLHFHVLAGRDRGPLRRHGQHVALHGQLDRIRVDSGQIEADHELVQSVGFAWGDRLAGSRISGRTAGRSDHNGNR
jgi:hypothetical protein